MTSCASGDSLGSYGLTELPRGLYIHAVFRGKFMKSCRPVSTSCTPLGANGLSMEYISIKRIEALVMRGAVHKA